MQKRRKGWRVFPNSKYSTMIGFVENKINALMVELEHYDNLMATLQGLQDIEDLERQTAKPEPPEQKNLALCCGQIAAEHSEEECIRRRREGYGD